MRFFEIARASALECSTMINCCITLEHTDKDLLAQIRTLLLRFVQMLSKLSPKRTSRYLGDPTRIFLVRSAVLLFYLATSPP